MDLVARERAKFYIAVLSYLFCIYSLIARYILARFLFESNGITYQFFYRVFKRVFIYFCSFFFLLIRIGMREYSDTTIKCWYLPDLVNLWQISLEKFRPEIGKVFLSLSYPIFPSENWAINKIWEEICNCNASLPRQNEIVTLFLNDITYLPSIFVFLSFFLFCTCLSYISK